MKCLFNQITTHNNDNYNRNTMKLETVIFSEIVIEP